MITQQNPGAPFYSQNFCQTVFTAYFDIVTLTVHQYTTPTPSFQTLQHRIRLNNVQRQFMMRLQARWTGSLFLCQLSTKLKLVMFRGKFRAVSWHECTKHLRQHFLHLYQMISNYFFYLQNPPEIMYNGLLVHLTLLDSLQPIRQARVSAFLSAMDFCLQYLLTGK